MSWCHVSLRTSNYFSAQQDILWPVSLLFIATSVLPWCLPYHFSVPRSLPKRAPLLSLRITAHWLQKPSVFTPLTLTFRVICRCEWVNKRRKLFELDAGWTKWEKWATATCSKWACTVFGGGVGNELEESIGRRNNVSKESVLFRSYVWEGWTNTHVAHREVESCNDYSHESTQQKCRRQFQKPISRNF